MNLNYWSFRYCLTLNVNPPYELPKEWNRCLNDKGWSVCRLEWEWQSKVTWNQANIIIEPNCELSWVKPSLIHCVWVHCTLLIWQSTFMNVMQRAKVYLRWLLCVNEICKMQAKCTLAATFPDVHLPCRFLVCSFIHSSVVNLLPHSWFAGSLRCLLLVSLHPKNLHWLVTDFVENYRLILFLPPLQS